MTSTNDSTGNQPYFDAALHVDDCDMKIAIRQGRANIGHEYFNVELGTWPNAIRIYLDRGQMSELAGKLTEALSANVEVTA